MPIDVFCEIARYLGPDDLLRMSRASKKLRNLLMTKYSKLIWRAAEKAVGLPECPLDLSSPQYASFIFDLFCSHLTPLRVRLCKTCSNQNLQKVSSWLGDEGLNIQSNEKELFSVLMLVNGLSITSSTEFTDEESVKALSISDLRNFMFYVPQVKAALVKYRSFDGTCEQREGCLDAGHEAARQRYLSAHTLNRSLEHIKEMKSKDEQIATERRERSIIIKLKELGYTNVDFQVYNDEEGWKWFNLIRQPRALTDRSRSFFSFLCEALTR
ncbi:hypothetical protein DFH11DRAFT_1591242 [Phellopilus nigrolimitatus]|nr:hypothetical protein DFH11DRAFT_1591242 [Phellopilus nigrolimitatus]